MTATLPSTYSFECPHCFSILSIPVEMEGVTGPCPHCQALIAAPPLHQQAPPFQPPAPVIAESAHEVPHWAYPPPPPSPSLMAPVPTAAPQPAPVPTWMDLVGDSLSNAEVFPSQPVETPGDSARKSRPAAKSPPKSPVLLTALVLGIAGLGLGVYYIINPPSSIKHNPPPTAPVEPQPATPDQTPSPAPPPPSGELPSDSDLPGPDVPLRHPTEPGGVNESATDPPAPNPPSTEINSEEIRRAKVTPTPTLVPEPTTLLSTNETPPTAIAASPLEPDPNPPAPGILDEPRAALEAFLAAPTWQQRLPMTQHADRLRGEITEYYTKHSDGAIRTESVDFLTSQPTPDGTSVFYLFNVQMHGGHALPVAVEKMQGTYRVDWRSFVEFKDLLLPDFFKTYSPEPATFHVVLERKHYFGTDVPNQDRKLCFSVEPPVPGYSNYAWVSDNSIELISKLGVRAEYGQTSYPIVSLRWVKESNGTAYVLLDAIISDNWRSDLTDKDDGSTSAPTKGATRDGTSATPASPAPKRARIVE